MVKPPPGFAKRALTAQQLKKHNFRSGQAGEITAAKYLQKHGYQILEQNIQVGRFEIDIIALDKKHQELVFVEVKNRINSLRGHPSQAVNTKKLYKMVAAAEIYLSRQRLRQDYRFDIIAVTPNRVEHFENISWNF